MVQKSGCARGVVGARFFGVEFRAAQTSDLPGLVRLFRAEELAEIGREECTDVEMRHILGVPGVDLARRSQVAVGEDGLLHGFVMLHPAPQPGQLLVQLSVDPHPDRHAIAARLLGLAGAWVELDRGAGDGDVSLFQLPGSLAADELAADGWQIVHSYTRMTADLPLTAAAGHRPPDPELEIQAAASEADLAVVHAVIEDAVAGHWQHQRRNFADFLAAMLARDGHDPSLWLLARVGGRPAGAVIARVPVDRAWIAWFGVRPDFRGHGVGGTLLRTVFALLADRGHGCVGVDVDTHNETGAVEVYRRAGMDVVGTADQWAKLYPAH
jgi:ribosomal protein S18 acetylase RimI-like enzyme